MKRLLIVWLLSLATSRVALAAVPTLVQGSVEPNDRRVLYLTFDTPLPAPADVMHATFWAVVITIAQKVACITSAGNGSGASKVR